MVVTASLCLLTLLTGAVLALAGWGQPLAVTHVAFAGGVLPLIFAAMMHFVPVLTRTGDPGRRLVQLPRLAVLVGLSAAAGFQGWLPYVVVPLAAAADLFMALILLNWIVFCRRQAIGTPHPGWRWYAVAIGCLILALSAVLLMSAWSSYWRSLRIFHLHLNTLGFVGLAALGTLPVLLPTAFGKADPEAGGWLRRRLWLVASGALVVATGAVIAWHFSAPGTALLFIATLGLIGQWVRRFGLTYLLLDGVTASLLAATIGLLMSLVGGLLHGAGILSTHYAVAGWGAGFLLPLVTGAASQLLPVWRWPGPITPARTQMRHRLALTGGWRGFLFVSAGGAFLYGEARLATALVGTGLALFIFAVLQAVRVKQSTR